MRLSIHGNRTQLAVLGSILVILGGVGLLPAQRKTDAQIITFGSDGAYLGITLEDVTSANMAQYKLSSETGAIVASVEKGSPADNAHIQANDVIVEYSGVPVFSVAELIRLVQETPVDRTLNLVLMRDGKKTTATIKTATRHDGGMAGRLNLISPNGVLRRFDAGPAGNGVFQFNVPGGGNRTFRYLAPFRPQLGATVEALTDQMADYLGVTGRKGVLITSVTRGTPAAAALRAGDVITSIDGKSVSAPDDLTSELSRKGADAKVELKIVRDRKEMTVSVTLANPDGRARGIRA